MINEKKKPKPLVKKDNAPIQWKNIRFVPIIHSRMEFALEVRRQFEAFRPDHVAVQFPSTLKTQTLKGV